MNFEIGNAFFFPGELKSLGWIKRKVVKTKCLLIKLKPLKKFDPSVNLKSAEEAREKNALPIFDFKMHFHGFSWIAN